MANKKKNSTKGKINGKTIINELKTPGLIILGMIGGNMAGKFIDKVLKVDESSGGFNAKALAKPIVQITAGVSGSILLKNDNLKLVASGVAASGMASAVKVFLKKDLLNGLGNYNISEPLQRVFREPLNLAIAPYNPDLPELPEHNAMPVEDNSMSGDELTDYQEIQEVQIL